MADQFFRRFLLISRLVLDAFGGSLVGQCLLLDLMRLPHWTTSMVIGKQIGLAGSGRVQFNLAQQIDMGQFVVACDIPILRNQALFEDIGS